MSWTTSTDGYAKSRLKRFQTLLQSKIQDLEDCFGNDTTLAFLNTNYPHISDTDCVKRGDYEQVWDIKTSGPFRIYVASGGHREGVDLTSENFYVQDGSTPGGRKRNYVTSITCLFHQNTFAIINANDQSTVREDAYMTVLDWLDFDVLGVSNVIKLDVSSNCFNNLSGHDFHYDTKITQAAKCFVQTGPGMTVTPTGLQVTVTGYT